MRPRADPSTDNWYGVQDARKRKQIQDRLAQRARRQRLANRANQGLEHSSSSESGSSLTVTTATQASRVSCPLIVDRLSVSPLPTLALYPKAGTSILPFSQSSHQPPSTPAASPGVDHLLFKLPSLTVYSAMYTNGRILGIPCVTSLVAKSAVTTPDIPLSLQPIPTQLHNVHFLFIDRFPLPRLRHNMIVMTDHFSAEEFIADLFSMPSFTITSGYQCWDEKGWSVAPEFKLKWEFLFR